MFQRFLTYIVGILLFAVAGLVAAPIFIDLGKYKEDFSNSIKVFTGVQPVIEGDVSVSFLPYPKLTLGNISIPNVDGAASPSILSADGVEAKFTFASLMKGKFDPSSITLLRPRIELEQMGSGQENWLKLLDNDQKSKAAKALNTPLNIKINNGTITYRIKSKKIIIDYISANMKINSLYGPIDFEGNFAQDGTNINFSGNIGNLQDNSEANLNINSEAFIFDMQGKYRPGKNFDIHGGASLNIKDIGKFVDTFLSEEPLLTQIKSGENLEIKGDFLVSDAITSFSKLAISSDSVKGTGSVDMLYGSGKEGETQWDIALNIDNINIDNLRKASNKETNTVEAVNYYTAGDGHINLASYHFDLPTDISALFSLSINEVLYNNDKISNISIDTDIFNGKAIIHSFSAQLPGNSKFEFMGNIDHNGTRPLLTGKVRAYGENLRTVLNWLFPQFSFIPENELKEFLFSCDLNVTPRKLTASNMYGSFDKSLLNGSIFVRPSDTVPSIKTDIKLDRMDFDRYNATKQIDNYVRQFLTSAKDSNIDTSWLKLFNYKLSLSVSGDELVYNKNNIKNFSAVIGAVRGLMNVQNITVDSDLLKMNGKVSFDLNKEVPVIDTDITAEYFDSAAFIISDEATGKNDHKKTETDESIWSREPFNMMGISRFNGNLNVVLNKFRHNDLFLNDINIKGDLKKDILSLNEFRSNWGEVGKISIKGSLGVSQDSPSIGVSAVASAIDMQDILRALGSHNTTTGKLYLGGVFKTFGHSPYDWIRELKTTAKFAMRDVTIRGLDLPTIISESRRLYSVIDMDVVIKNASKEGTTRFTAIDGNLITDKSILQARDFTLATEQSRGLFVGNVSMHNLKMKGIAKINYMPESNKQVTIGLNLEGEVPDNITYKLDSSNLEQYITGKANK